MMGREKDLVCNFKNVRFPSQARPRLSPLRLFSEGPNQLIQPPRNEPSRKNWHGKREIRIGGMPISTPVTGNVTSFFSVTDLPFNLCQSSGIGVKDLLEMMRDRVIGHVVTAKGRRNTPMVHMTRMNRRRPTEARLPERNRPRSFQHHLRPQTLGLPRKPISLTN